MPRRRLSRYAFHRRLRLLRRSQRRSKGRRAFLLVAMLILALPLMVIPAFAAESVGNLPAVDGLSATGLNQDMLIFDRHGTLIDDIGDHGDHRIVVPLNSMSPFVKQATIAIEDKTFYKNNGVDFGGIVRAALADYSHHHIAQGGSTISQQLVKQVFIGPNPPPAIQPKIRDAVLAVDLNSRYSKDQILELYLNTIYYGAQSYGAEAAARGFFHTTAHDLTLGQAAMLAGLPQAPTQNSPLINPTRAKARQIEVLDAMVAQKMITPAQALAAENEKLQFFYPTNQLQAPHFVDYVLQVLDQQYHIRPSDRKGYRVYTSLDLNVQHLAESVVKNQIDRFGNYYDFHDGALVSMDPKTGEVLAMVGGDNYYRPGGQINMATTNTRQPGSSFKMFTYTSAIESGRLNMVSPIRDQPMVFPLGGGKDGLKPYAPINYDKHYHGTLPLKMAMGNSLNLPGRHVGAKTGTTQDFRDNWTVGFTPTLATAVWVGNPDYHPLAHNSTGIVGAAPIWHQFMTQALASQPDQWYGVPAGVDQVGQNYFLPGTESLPATLAGSWPVCRFRSFNPYTVTDAQLTVNGLPCVLGYTPRDLGQGG